MEPRRLGQIWQFGLGSGWAAIGVLGLLIFSGLHYFLPPPLVEELHPVSGVLLGRVEVHHPSKGQPWASFALRAPNMTLSARVDNYGLLWGRRNNSPGLLRLEEGAQITVWLMEKDISRRTDAVVWRMRNSEEYLLTFEQSLAAYQAQERRLFIGSLGFLVIGLALSVWGWRISIAEQRRFRNAL